MSFSHDTMITVADGSKKAIQNFSQGDSVWVAETADLKSWIQKPVMFSSGTAGQVQNTLFKITFESGSGTASLFVTRDQPFLMPDKSLKKARKLIPYTDVLLMENGNTCPVLALEAGTYNKGIHGISLSERPASSLDGHLFIANGIVAGDYSLELGLKDNLSQSAE